MKAWNALLGTDQVYLLCTIAALLAVILIILVYRLRSRAIFSKVMARMAELEDFHKVVFKTLGFKGPGTLTVITSRRLRDTFSWRPMGRITAIYQVGSEKEQVVYNKKTLLYLIRGDDHAHECVAAQISRDLNIRIIKEGAEHYVGFRPIDRPRKRLLRINLPGRMEILTFCEPQITIPIGPRKELGIILTITADGHLEYKPQLPTYSGDRERAQEYLPKFLNRVLGEGCCEDGKITGLPVADAYSAIKQAADSVPETMNWLLPPIPQGA